MEGIDFHNLLANSYLILIDSGEIQEEAPVLGKPIFVARATFCCACYNKKTRRYYIRLSKIGCTDEKVIYKNFMELLENKEIYDAIEL